MRISTVSSSNWFPYFCFLLNVILDFLNQVRIQITRLIRLLFFFFFLSSVFRCWVFYLLWLNEFCWTLRTKIRFNSFNWRCFILVVKRLTITSLLNFKVNVLRLFWIKTWITWVEIRTLAALFERHLDGIELVFNSLRWLI